MSTANNALTLAVGPRMSEAPPKERRSPPPRTTQDRFRSDVAISADCIGTGPGEVINPAVEERWLREHLRRTDWEDSTELCRAAYRHGVHSAAFYPGREFREVESEIRFDWENAPSQRLEWAAVRGLIEDAYVRTAQALFTRGRRRR
ncbi:MAG TPA: hypothetical protein VNC50_05135 [Planctomycetia bacterium]|nr:hypothetical protein [Planctomycetia bacterium]